MVKMKLFAALAALAIGITLLAVGLQFASPSQASSSKSYSIPTVHIDATLNRDGSMRVSEKRTYDFSGSFSFAYQYIKRLSDQATHSGRTEPYTLKNFSVCEGVICYTQLQQDRAESGDPMLPTTRFYVTEDADQYYIKWFYRAYNETKTFTINYTVQNAVTQHTDTAELYWKLIGDDWSLIQRNVTATIVLPPNIPGDKIQAWAHGPLNGTVRISDPQHVEYSTPLLSSGKFFEARILMPKITFTGGAKGTLTEVEIRAQEQEFIVKTERQKATLRVLVKVLAGVSLLISALSLFIINTSWRRFVKYHKDGPLPQINQANSLWEPPNDIDPAQIEQLFSMQKSFSPKAFTATVLSLVQHRFVKITRSDKKEGVIFKDYKYYLEQLPNPRKSMSDIEKAVFDFIFVNVGEEPIGTKKGDDRVAVPLESIVSYCQTHRTTSYSFFQHLQNVVYKENFEEGYFDKIAHKLAGKLLLPLAFFIPATIVQGLILAFTAEAAGVLRPLFQTLVSLGPFISGAAFACTIVFAGFAEKRTEKGRRETAQWLAFQKHMRDYRQTRKYPIDSIMWSIGKQWVRIFRLVCE